MTSAALGFEIIGTGHYVARSAPSPTRSFPRDGHVGRVDLQAFRDPPAALRARGGRRERPRRRGRQACHRGRAASRPRDIDYIVFATMTPDYVFPGSAALVGAKLGIDGVPGLDIRQQCGAMLFGMQLVDGLIKSGAAKTILFIGAEAHAGFMPWDDWDVLMGESDRPVTPEARERANAHRALAVLFGDGAGALVFRATDRDAGLRGIKIHTDGRGRQAPLRAGRRLPHAPVLEEGPLRRAGAHPPDGREGAVPVRSDQAARSGARALRGARRSRSTRSTGSSPTRPTSESTTTCVRTSGFPSRRCR